jgi:hypothetical protein
VTKSTTAFATRNVGAARVFARLMQVSAAALSGILLVSAIVASERNVSQVAIKDAGFEGAIRAGEWKFFQHAGDRAYRIEHDTEQKTEGEKSLRITQYASQVYASLEQSVSGLAPGKYEFTADVRAEVGSGRGWFLKVSVRERATGAFDVILSRAFIAQPNWARGRVEFTVTDPSQTVAFGATLRGQADSKAWIDNARLVRVSD